MRHTVHAINWHEARIGERSNPHRNSDGTEHQREMRTHVINIALEYLLRGADIRNEHTSPKHTA